MKKYIITINGSQYEVVVEEADANAVYTPDTKSEPKPVAAKPVANGKGTKVNAPLPGNILKVNVTVGANVKKGDLLCVLEAMKMENEILAPCDGKISSAVAKGTTVNTNDLLFVIA